MILLLAVIAVFIVLVASELLWRQQKIHSEFSRKFVHITVGSLVAFWPYFLSRKEILLLSAAFIAVVLISKKYNVFSSIHTVQRPTNGELYFAIMVGALALANVHPHIFTASLLVMSLSDGFAAVFGTRFGKGNSYKVFGAQKSVVGTFAFFVVTCTILAVYSARTSGTAIGFWVLPLSLATTLIENILKRGLDNLAVPVLITLALQALA
jgi:phytol kinase